MYNRKKTEKLTSHEFFFERFIPLLPFEGIAGKMAGR
jgi:hypothetical protein